MLRGRFAPSPSGEMHLGNIWTALLAWLSARHSGGKMVLRVEDLDPDRSKPIYAQQIVEDLKWLGLDWDEGPDVGGDYGPYCQNERRELYRQAVRRLRDSGLIYACYCSRAELHSPSLAPHAGETEWIYPGTCRNLSEERLRAKEQAGRKPQMRIKVPDRIMTFVDRVYGSVQQNLRTDCGDFVIERADGVHAYQLAVVIDDAAMKISEVVRGADLLTSTPRQLFLYEALGLRAPTFAHVPLLLGADGHRLSKRQRDLSLAAMRQKGAKPETIIGFLAYKAGIVPVYQPAKAKELISEFSFDRLACQPVTIDTIPF